MIILSARYLFLLAKLQVAIAFEILVSAMERSICPPVSFPLGAGEGCFSPLADEFYLVPDYLRIQVLVRSAWSSMREIGTEIFHFSVDKASVDDFRKKQEEFRKSLRPAWW